jgi:ATP-binding cassette subfamily B protein/subfamily B ATP-binding cassette protein MsbA
MILIKMMNTFITSRLSAQLSIRLRHDLLTRLHAMSLGAHRARAGGEWDSRVLFDADRLRGLLSSAVLKTVHNVLVLVAATAFLLLIAPQLTLPVVVFIPVAAVVALRWSRRLQPGYADQQRIWDRIVGLMSSRLRGRAEIAAYGRADDEIARFDELAGQYREMHTRTTINRTQLSSALELCTYIVTAVLVFVGGVQLLSGNAGHELSTAFHGARALMPAGWMLVGVHKMMASMGMAASAAALSAGALSAFVLFAGRMVGPIRGLSHQYGELARMQVAARRVLDVLDAPVEREGGMELPPVAGRLAFEDVWFSYNRGPAVVRGVSFTVEPGQRVALVGPTGAGKTTLVQLLGGFYEPERGRVTVDGHDLREVSLRSLREQVMAVPQDTDLFEGTVAENIRFGRPDASEEEVIAAARDIGAHETLQALPAGYETRVGDNGRRLSSGQRQLVALARASLANPRVIVFDEALSAVDAATQDTVLQALQRLLAGRTAVLVTHQLDVLRHVDELLVLDAGRIVEHGSLDELVRAGDRFARLWDAGHRRVAAPAPRPRVAETAPTT